MLGHMAARAPRFVPRKLSPTPALFGKNRDLVFIQPTDRDAHLLAAALFQHRMSFVVTETIAHRRWSIKKLAEESGITYARLVRVLRGHVPVQVADVGALVVALDLDIVVRRKPPAEMTRPASRA